MFIRDLAMPMSDQQCTCPRITLEDDPCPVHGYPKCPHCGEDEHDYISCQTVANIKARVEARNCGEGP